MDIKKIEGRWVIVQYNYVALLPEDCDLGDEQAVHLYLKKKIRTFCKEYPENDLGYYHVLESFMSIDMLNMLINGVKYTLYNGLVERNLCFVDTQIHYTLNILINADMFVELTVTSDEFDNVHTYRDVSLDDLEFFETEGMKALLESMSNNAREKCVERAMKIREKIEQHGKGITSQLSNCELTLIDDERLLYLL